MKKKVFNLILYASAIKYIFIIISFLIFSRKRNLRTERDAWYNVIFPDHKKDFVLFLRLLNLAEYRSVLYYRLGGISLLFRWLARGQYALYINTKNIGDNLIIQHGHSTQISAKSIGKNCQIWHNVTIGTNHSHSNNLPIIGDDVKIGAGAIVIGNIEIGSNVTIGAGSVVVKDLPTHCIAAGNPARIIKFSKQS